jgi:multidrug efflux system outer membrane protein
MTRHKLFLAFLLTVSLTACKVGPNYQRPATTVPAEYRGLPPSPQPAGEAFGDMKWWAVFQDQALQNLIRTALQNNYDIRIAATRVVQAQANVGIVRANQFPQVNGNAAIINERNQVTEFTNTNAPTYGSLGISMSYIVDFWGQYRRATEAARAQLLGSEYAQNVVRTTLVSQVATDYFLLRAYDSQLKYAQDTITADEEILKLNNIRFKGGEASAMEVYQAEVLLQAAQAQAITLQGLIEQTENNISILLGQNPGPVVRGIEVTEQPHFPEVPAGLPSALLERRPDIRVAEENLVSANANVGVAKANFFPQFALTGLFGAQSTALSTFTAGPGTFWAIGLQAAQPIFQGGRIRSEYKLAWAQRDEAELVYKKTVNQAFGDVSNSLVGYTQARQYRLKIEEQTKSYGDAAHLADVRFRGGVTSFLEVQYNQQQYFNSLLQLSQAWYSELANYVSLYQALGGGWQQ